MTATAILRHLPEDSALSRYRRGWTLAEHVAIRALEEASALTRVTLWANGAKKHTLPEALVLDRPTPEAVRDGTLPPPTHLAAKAPQAPQDAPPAPKSSRWFVPLLDAKANAVQVAG